MSTARKLCPADRARRLMRRMRSKLLDASYRGDHAQVMEIWHELEGRAEEIIDDAADDGLIDPGEFSGFQFCDRLFGGVLTADDWILVMQRGWPREVIEAIQRQKIEVFS